MRAHANPGTPTRLVTLWALSVALTAVGALLGVCVPALAPGGTPQPTLSGSPHEALSIFTHNLRVLAVPLILAATHWGRTRVTRGIGDVAVTATFLISPLLIGAAIGRHGPALLVYLPHVPLEWLALSAATVGWYIARHQDNPAPGVGVCSALAITFTAIAAVIETVAIPHAR